MCANQPGQSGLCRIRAVRDVRPITGEHAQSLLVAITVVVARFQQMNVHKRPGSAAASTGSMPCTTAASRTEMSGPSASANSRNALA